MAGDLGHFEPGKQLRLERGGQLIVGRFVGQGGQGWVLEVARQPQLVFKQLRPKVLEANPTLTRRLAVMIGNPPPNWQEPSSGHVWLTWPQDMVFDGARLVGFVMPNIDTSLAPALHHITNPTDRRNPGPMTPGWVRGFTWAYLLQTAANLALATDSVHSSGYVIGDFNESNILVTGEARVTVIDCDSMQVPDPSGGVFYCDVGRYEFTAPELTKRSARHVVRAPSSDLFPLAVHIHQLLMQGAHPFDGVWRGPGERRPDRWVLASRGSYVYQPNRELVPAPHAISFGLLPPPLQELFRRAFVAGARNPDARPTASEWRRQLGETMARLKTCPKKAQHIYAQHLTRCPWCERDEELGQQPDKRMEEPQRTGAPRRQPTATATANARGTAPARGVAAASRVRRGIAAGLVSGVAFLAIIFLTHHESKHNQPAVHAASTQSSTTQRVNSQTATGPAISPQATAAIMRSTLKKTVEEDLPIQYNWPTRCAHVDPTLWRCGVRQDPAMYRYTVNVSDTKILKSSGPFGVFLAAQAVSNSGQSFWGLAPAHSEAYWFDQHGPCAADGELEYQSENGRGYFDYFRVRGGRFVAGVNPPFIPGDPICIYLQTGQTTRLGNPQEQPVGHLLSKATG